MAIAFGQAERISVILAMYSFQLCPFSHFPFPYMFQCEDCLIPHVVHSLKTCYQALADKAPKEIKLKRFTTQGYIGLFLEEDAASWFREIMKLYSVDCKKHGMHLEVRWVSSYAYILGGACRLECKIV